jgi:hypothetical protein
MSSSGIAKERTPMAYSESNLAVSAVMSASDE